MALMTYQQATSIADEIKGENPGYLLACVVAEHITGYGVQIIWDSPEGAYTEYIGSQQEYDDLAKQAAREEMEYLDANGAFGYWIGEDAR